MTQRLSRFLLSGCLLASLGCQNPVGRSAKFGDRDNLETRLSFASDDLSGLDQGRGHLPSLASEMADRRHRGDDGRSTGIPGGSSLTVQRLLERGHDADAHGRNQEAKMYYEEVLAEQPHHPEAHHRLAILADRVGDYSLAESHYQQALRGNPNDPDVLNDYGYSCFLQGRGAESERYLIQAQQINPSHPHVQENLSLLYDPLKAEKVLMTVMGPRQAQATLARLFSGQPDGGAAPQIAQRPNSERRIPPRPASTTPRDVPPGLDDLHERMVEARMRSIAERTNRKAAESVPNAGRWQNQPPQRPVDYPPQLAQQRGLGPAREVPDGRINDAFRNIDNSGHSMGNPSRDASFAANQSSQVPLPTSNPSPGYPPSEMSQPLANRPLRAATPEWNQPPQNWPQVPPAQHIEQTSYNLRHGERPQSPSQSSAAQRAAEIGMSAGPGAIFPHLNDGYDSNAASQGPVPAGRSLPGTNSRMNGTMYAPPNEQALPSNWNAPEAPPRYQDTRSSQTTGWNTPELPNQFQSAPGHPSRHNSEPNRFVPDDYEAMRALENRQFNQDQRYLAGNPNLMSNGPPPHEALPSNFDPNQQPWPAYSREQYDTRAMDPPPNLPNPAYSGQPPQYGGQSLPPGNMGYLGRQMQQSNW